MKKINLSNVFKNLISNAHEASVLLFDVVLFPDDFMEVVFMAIESFFLEIELSIAAQEF
jgi:hypothetical protein